MSLTVPGSNFTLKNDNNIYQFVGYNYNNDILYRYNNINQNYNVLYILTSTVKENICKIIYEPILFHKYHIRFNQ